MVRASFLALFLIAFLWIPLFAGAEEPLLTPLPGFSPKLGAIHRIHKTDRDGTDSSGGGGLRQALRFIRTRSDLPQNPEHPLVQRYFQSHPELLPYLEKRMEFLVKMRDPLWNRENIQTPPTPPHSANLDTEESGRAHCEHFMGASSDGLKLLAWLIKGEFYFSYEDGWPLIDTDWLFMNMERTRPEGLNPFLGIVGRGEDRDKIFFLHDSLLLRLSEVARGYCTDPRLMFKLDSNLKEESGEALVALNVGHNEIRYNPVEGSSENMLAFCEKKLPGLNNHRCAHFFRMMIGAHELLSLETRLAEKSTRYPITAALFELIPNEWNPYLTERLLRGAFYRQKDPKTAQENLKLLEKLMPEPELLEPLKDRLKSGKNQ